MSIDSLAEYDAVIPAYPQSTEIKQQQKKLKASATSTDREGVAFLILTGRYIGFLPTHYADRWVQEGKFIAIKANQLNYLTNFSAVIRKGMRSDFILETFLDKLGKTTKM